MYIVTEFSTVSGVFKEELDFLEMNKVREYPDTDLPLLWAEGIRKYIVEGSVVGKISLECDLCLKNYDYDLDFKIKEMYYFIRWYKWKKQKYLIKNIVI